MESEVFKEFVRIAQEKEKVDDHKLKSTRRYHSSDVKKLEELYNIKPERIDGKEYEENMAEIAHPEPYVLSPSYDKPNGLIENVNERHSLIKEVIDRQPRGQHTNRTVCAKKELSLNLVRLGNDLDTANDELSKLADRCLNQTIQKKAGLYLIPLILGGISAISAVNKSMPAANQGLKLNTKNLVIELQDIITSNSDFGIGKKYNKNLISITKHIINKVTAFTSSYVSEFKELQKIEVSGAKNLLENGAELAESVKQNKDKLMNLLSSTESMITYINGAISLFEDDSVIRNSVDSSGEITNLLEGNKLVKNLLDVVNPVDDINDVVKSLKVYLESLEHIISTINGSSAHSADTEDLVDKMLKQKGIKDHKQKNTNDLSLEDLANFK